MLAKLKSKKRPSAVAVAQQLDPTTTTTATSSKQHASAAPDEAPPPPDTSSHPVEHSPPPLLLPGACRVYPHGAPTEVEPTENVDDDDDDFDLYSAEIPSALVYTVHDQEGATPMDAEQQELDTLQQQQQQETATLDHVVMIPHADAVHGVYVSKKRGMAGALCVLVAIAIIAGVSVAVKKPWLVHSTTTTSAGNNNSTFENKNSQWWVVNHTNVEKAALSLPSYTVHALWNDLPPASRTLNWYKDDLWSNTDFEPHSSQGQAWKWLVSHATILSYSPQDITTRFVLAVFYFSTNGRYWKNTTHWLDPKVHVCEWYSLAATMDWKVYSAMCTQKGFGQIMLSDNNLSGTLPRELELLSSSLLNLEVNANQLRGRLPHDFGAPWPNLSVLRLSDNHFSGTLSTVLGSLKQLTLLEVSDNQLSGRLPTELGRATMLFNVQLYGNLFSGPIPTELGRCKQAVALLLAKNRFTGSIPTEIGNMKSLHDLSVEENHLTGPLPTELGMLKGLYTITAYNNSLSGVIPTTIGRKGNRLMQISLAFNKLTGSLPSEIGLLTQLKYFHVDQNLLKGSIPSEIGNAKALADLDLFNNSITGTIPTELGQLSGLTKLQIAQTLISGTVPIELCKSLTWRGGELSVNCQDVLCTCNCTCDRVG